MKSLLSATVLLVLGSTAHAVSNGPLPHYVMNYGCGPEDRIPQACASESETKNYCTGFKHLVENISNAGNHIAAKDYVVWCWTILEDWTQCRIPSPKLQTQCLNYAKDLAAPATEGSCQALGFEVARQMYQDDIKLKCPATE
ncbi:MAG TPA: hypothetical protein VE954_01240 [Oligoflexus sp.]|uniref:hypothetical protein n=1 Tax=Oligoflexus sp. TaxID=1971216 RepID=UPI002D347C58|nr:hypothetical protein [Oligoflexus sp.]HYX31706.1 hypothetical protein [Oligoflexus sp.]